MYVKFLKYMRFTKFTQEQNDKNKGDFFFKPRIVIQGFFCISLKYALKKKSEHIRLDSSLKKY